MNAVAMEQKKRIHPYKLNLWLGIGSILMMFAGLTSALIVKRNLTNWVSFEIPLAFWLSTGAIVLSSVLLYLAERSFKTREMPKYKSFLLGSIVLGVLFIILQVIGFKELWNAGITLQKSVSYSFLWVIVLMHAFHVIGGLVALVVLYIRSFSSKIKNYDFMPVDVTSTYWHFVDILWIYLLIFLIMIR